MANREDILERLKDVHSFPGNYMIKVIGSNSEEFVTQAVQACLLVLGPSAAPGVSTRESSGGKHLAITLDLEVPDAETVLRLYDVLQDLDGVKFML